MNNMGNYISMDDAPDPMVEMGSFQLFYNEKYNIMEDEAGFPVFNIFEYIEPNIYLLFKQNKEYMATQSKIGPWVELIWPEHDES